MSKKLNIPYDNKALTMSDALLIPTKRGNDLDHRFQLILHDLFRPVKKGDDRTIATDEIFKLYISLAENTQELAYCAYMAGMKTEELFGDALERSLNEENDEE